MKSMIVESFLELFFGTGEIYCGVNQCRNTHLRYSWRKEEGNFPLVV
jgi:hypothetical protein